MSAMPRNWLLLTYRARRDPSRHRVSVWRRLKAAGALYLQDSVCALPDTAEHRALFERLAVEVRDNDGQALVLVAQGLADTDEHSVIERFNAERDRDYAEITEQCAVLMDEFERERTRGRFTYAELEDTEGNLDRLRRWIERVGDRDFFASPGAAEAHAALAACGQEHDRFTADVLAHSEMADDDDRL